MTKIDNKRKLDEIVLKKLQDILYENAELLNKYNFKELYDIANKSLMYTSMYISDLTYLLMVAGIDPLKYMDEIPEEYFAYNNDLISIDIPGNIKSIGNNAFHDCSRLTSVTIPDSVTRIGSYAFGNCGGLTNVTIGKGVTRIRDHAFYYCRGLASIIIPDSVTSIGDFAFEGCSGLTSITIGNNVKSIGWDAFVYCRGLTSVTIGNGMISIGDEAFKYCKELTDIIYMGTVEQWKKIKKEENDFSEVKIHCIDGEV